MQSNLEQEEIHHKTKYLVYHPAFESFHPRKVWSCPSLKSLLFDHLGWWLYLPPSFQTLMLLDVVHHWHLSSWALLLQPLKLIVIWKTEAGCVTASVYWLIYLLWKHVECVLSSLCFYLFYTNVAFIGHQEEFEVIVRISTIWVSLLWW